MNKTQGTAQSKGSSALGIKEVTQTTPLSICLPSKALWKSQDLGTEKQNSQCKQSWF